MCGVAAIVGGAPPGANVDGAAAAIAGRGPDGTERWSSDGLLLVASRLAHWDEGAPRQPWVGRGVEEGAAAAFNGELFNLTELQGAVGRPGASEIEVLVVGLRDEGPGFLTRIDGQFAGVVRVAAGGPTYAVRDRFGIAPLYWAELPDGVALGSNLRSVLALRGTAAEDDLDGLASILAEWAPIGDLSPWAGVHQVRPGHVLTIEDGRAAGQRRWAAPPGAAAGEPAELDLDGLETALRQAVGVRLRSTGRVACLLSGGIDSTVIGALAAEQGARLGLALCLEGDDLVAQRQRQVADALGMELIQHVLTPAETVDLFEEYVATRQVPLVRLGPVGMMALARRARAEGIRAVLSGEGADELFAGYDSYRILAARGGLFGPVKDLPWADFGTPEFGADRGPTWAKSYWRGLIQFSTDAGARRLDILRPVADAFASPLREVITGELPAPSAVDPLPATDDIAALLEHRRQVDLAHLLAGYLLTVQGDHAWMEEGVELRPPYLAAPVADWALRHSPARFVSVENGKAPIRGLLTRLATRNPALAELGFAKAAFRVDAGLLLRDAAAADPFVGLATDAADGRLFDVDELRSRLAHVRTADACREVESELLTLAASLGALVTGRHEGYRRDDQSPKPEQRPKAAAPRARAII